MGLATSAPASSGAGTTAMACDSPRAGILSVGVSYPTLGYSMHLKEASWTLSLGDQLRGCFGKGQSDHRAKVGRRDLGNGRASNGHSFCWERRLLQAAAPPSLQVLPLSCPL